MAKIILSENPSEEFTYETTCRKCSTRFSYNKIDTYKHVSMEGDRPSLNRYVDCPKCSFSIFTSLKNPVSSRIGDIIFRR